MTKPLALRLLPEKYAVLQLEPRKPIELLEDRETELFAVIQTLEETTVVCAERLVPENRLLQVEKGWRALKVTGVLEFELVGILAALLDPLAKAGVSVFSLSTYSTDVILVKETRLEDALMALTKAGYPIIL
jgi:hypothetical protein